MLTFLFQLLYQSHRNCLVFATASFSSLPNGEYSNLFIVAAISSKAFSGKTSLLVKNSYLLKFPDDRAEILAVRLSKLY